MQTAILIQKSIQRQATARKKLPSPIAQFKTFLNRGAKPSPEKDGIDWEADEPTGGQPTGETAGDAPDAPAGETAGEPAAPSQDAPETPQGASAEGTGEAPPPPPAEPQGETAEAPAKGGKGKGAKKRGK